MGQFFGTEFVRVQLILMLVDNPRVAPLIRLQLALPADRSDDLDLRRIRNLGQVMPRLIGRDRRRLPRWNHSQ